MEGRIGEFLNIKPDGKFVFLSEANIRYLIGEYVDGMALIVDDDYKIIFPEMMREEAEMFPNSETGNLKDYLEEGMYFEPSADAELLMKYKGRIDRTVLNMRAVKSSAEIEKLMEAQQKSAEMLLRMADFLSMAKDEMTERDAAAYMMSYAIENGIEMAFPPIIASMQSSSRPHSTPGNAKIGGYVLVDIGVRIDGYCGDITRPVLLEKPPPAIESDITRIAEAHEALMGDMKGLAFKDVHEKAKSLIGNDLIHSIGHGIGIEVHEKPALDDILEKNNVLTIEPGVYRRSMYGVRIEDMLIVGRGKVRAIDSFALEMF